ncbi:MAG: PepSY domain-containing protein [Anaerolineaceae bacterium]|nr:PepSY domain-containing protein [Anaerolineaceae bacterium]
MKPSKALLLSLIISGVIIFIAAEMTSLIVANNKAEARETQYQQLIAQDSQQIDQDNQQIGQAYQHIAQANQSIEQANQQIVEANAEIKSMQAKLTQAQPAPDKSTTSQASTAPANNNSAGAAATITSDQATQTALQAAGSGQTALKAAELVDFQGKVAYEVEFNKGFVYIDANSGDVLFNGTAPQQITADMAGQIASNYLNNKNILQIDKVIVGGRPLYRVIFKNGYIAYLDLTGQITNINPS